MLWNYPEARWRSLLVFAMMGGLMGLPGADDMKGIIKALAWQLFGKDFDVEREARGLVHAITSGKVSPDLLLHGAGRYGFGLPQVMAMLGVPAPSLDVSRSVGLGRLLPVDLGELGVGASKDPQAAGFKLTQQALGYMFQVNANIYNTLLDTQLSWTDAQRWTKALPRAAQGVSKAWQAAAHGEVQTRTGARVIKVDLTDAAQLGEVVGMALGFQPTRLTAKWDLVRAQREVEMYWDIRRQILLRQLWQARQTGDKESYKRELGAIRKFNEMLPASARGKAITAEDILQSFRTRMQAKQAFESGVPRQRGNIPIAREIQRLYPEAEVDVRRVR
jgi:hypothetical protein